MWLNFLPIVSHYTTDVQVAVTHHEMQQCADTGSNIVIENTLKMYVFMRKEMHLVPLVS